MTVPAPVVAAEHLGKRYGAHLALDDVSFTLAPGEVAALLGPNGAGKTSLIGCLLGFLLPSAGAARLFGQNAADLSPELRGRTGFVPQKMTGFTQFRVGELIRYIGQFYATPPAPPPGWLLDWADLDMGARVKNLSGGQSQRLSILLALHHQPDLVILDEPVASLDPQARRDFMALLARYCAESGRAALISSHILSDLERVVTRALFMRRGRLIHDTPMQRFRASTRWLTLPAEPGAAALHAALPDRATLLGTARDTGALLVDGWDEATATLVGQRLGFAIETQAPDLEAAFLEMTR